MTLRLHLLLNQVYYVPGDAVLCTVQVYNDDAESLGTPTHVKEISFQSTGVERSDPSWISNAKLYRPEVKPDKPDARKRVRIIYKTDTTSLASDVLLQAGSVRQYHVKFRLPQDIPPSFKGSSLRFSYSMDVKALYEPQPRPGLAPVLYETTATTSLLIWPPPLVLHSPVQEGYLASVTGSQHNSHGGHADPLASHRASGGGASAVSGAGPASPRVQAGSQVDQDGQQQQSQASSQQPHPQQHQQQQQQWELPMLEYRLQQVVKVKVKAQPEENPYLHSLTAPYSPSASLTLASLSLGPSATPTPQASVGRSLDQAVEQRQSTTAIPRPSSFIQPRLSAEPLSLGLHAHPRLHHPHQKARHSWSDSSSDSDSDREGINGTAGARHYTAMHKGSSGRRPSINNPLAGTPHTKLGSGSGSSSTGTLARTSLQQQFSTGSNKASVPQAGSGGRMLLARPLPHSNRSFLLNCGEHPVVRITLQAPLDSPLQPGATFGGVIDLRPQQQLPHGSRQQHVPAALQCHQLVVMLETEESITQPSQQRNPQATDGSTSSSIRRLHCEHQEVTTDLAVSHFMFSIPVSATPSFRTPIVSLRWVLRFELTVGKPVDYSTGSLRMDVSSMQQLSWVLPLVVQVPG